MEKKIVIEEVEKELFYGKCPECNEEIEFEVENTYHKFEVDGKDSTFGMIESEEDEGTK